MDDGAMREKMLHIAERLEKRADAILSNLWNEYWNRLREYEEGAGSVRLRKKDLPPLPLPKSQMAGALNIMAEEIRETLETLKLSTPLGCADRMTTGDFTKHCEAGAFVDSDGSGYYGNIDMQSNRPARPSRIAGGDIDKIWSYVYWYNK